MFIRTIVSVTPFLLPGGCRIDVLLVVSNEDAHGTAVTANTANTADANPTAGDAGQTDTIPFLDNIGTMRGDGGQVPIEEQMVVRSSAAGGTAAAATLVQTAGGEDGGDEAGGQSLGQRGGTGRIGSTTQRRCRCGRKRGGDALHDGVVR